MGWKVLLGWKAAAVGALHEGGEASRGGSLPQILTSRVRAHLPLLDRYLAGYRLLCPDLCNQFSANFH